MSPEAIIRDYLADNLSFIDDGLTLIDKEYPVPNYMGSKGFIDLLAKDVFNNFVIIEIKRSRATSRETVQEIIKYVGLLKQNFRVRDSEIKIIILSTDWKELLVPFSELVYQTTLSVKGFKLELNPAGIPIQKVLITPLKVGIERRLARTAFFHLFKTDLKRSACIDYLKKKCAELNITDYILVKLFKDKARDPDLPYEYALYFSFQSLSKDEYLAIIKKAGEALDMEEEEFEEPSEFISHLEETLIVAVDAYSYNDGGEGGYPEKFESVIGIQEWEIEEIMRFGIFHTDPRYNMEMLLRELRGLDGASEIKYLNFGESSHIDRFSEVKENCIAPLKYNQFWADHLQSTLEFLEQLNRPFRFVVDVFHPLSIFDGIWRAMDTGNFGYLPMYMLFVDFIEDDKLWVFGGRLSWTGKAVDITSLVEYLNDDSEALINKFIDSSQGFNDEEILKCLSLEYENTLAEFKNDEIEAESNIRFDGNEMIRFDSNNARSIFEWIDENSKLKAVLAQYYKTYTNYFGP